MFFMPHKLHRLFFPLSPSPPPEISRKEQSPYGRASQRSIRPQCALYRRPSPVSSTTRPILFHIPIVDRFRRPDFILTESLSTTESLSATESLSTTETWRQPTSSTSPDSQITDMFISSPSTVSPSELSTRPASTDSLCTESSLGITSNEGVEGKEEEGIRLDSIDINPLSASKQAFHIDISVEEQSVQVIGGASLKMRPRDASSPTIDIQPPFDDAGHHEQKTARHSKTLHNIKNSLRDFGQLVMEPWNRFKKKSGRTPNSDEHQNPRPFSLTVTAQQHNNSPQSDHRTHIARPDRPAQFPFQTKTADPLHQLRQSTNSAKTHIHMTTDSDESRHRERLHRRALKRLKSIGRFRRRPNLIPQMTEDRATEPVEVARIRRAYTQRRFGGRKLSQGERTKESLLERINRQRRAQVQEWRVTRLSSLLPQARKSSSTSTRVTAVVTVPLQDAIAESRPSLGRTINTRTSGNKSMRNGANPAGATKSRFASRWNKYESRKLEVLREPFQETELIRKIDRENLCSRRSGQRNPCYVRAPSPLRRFNSITTSSHTPVPPSPTYLSVHDGSTLPTLASSIARNRHSYVSRSNLGSATNSRRSSRFLAPIAQASNRISVVSVASCNSAASSDSSMANSIYSVLSEDWNRPFFFARSKSVRCPTSLQSNLRALPPYDQLTASIASTSVEKVKMDPLTTAAAGIAGSTRLQNHDGSDFQLSPGHELHSVDIRITWRPVTESFVEDNDDPALAISRPCLSALPKARDRFGFVEYDDEDDEDEERSQDQRHYAVFPDTANIPAVQCRLAGPDDWILVDAGRPILDVNDTSAMIAAGINPSEPHPNPEAFYLLNYPTDNQNSIYTSQELSTEKDKDACNCRLYHYPDCSAASDNSVDDPKFKQSLRSTQNKIGQPISTCLWKPHNSRVVQKWICKPLKTVFSSQKQRSTRCTATEIRRVGAGMHPSYTNTVTSVGTVGWIHQLPGGCAAAGRFDRDWLDAQPSSSS